MQSAPYGQPKTGPAPCSSGVDRLPKRCAQCHAIGRSGSSPHVGAPPLHQLDRRLDLEGLVDRSAGGARTASSARQSALCVRARHALFAPRAATPLQLVIQSAKRLPMTHQKHWVPGVRSAGVYIEDSGDKSNRHEVLHLCVCYKAGALRELVARPVPLRPGEPWPFAVGALSFYKPFVLAR